jgi:4-carboxymuconolactone decarboxylase
MTPEERQKNAQEVGARILAPLRWAPPSGADVWPVERELAELAAAFAFGEVWPRETIISPKVRSLLTVGILTALYRPDQLRLHINGALNHGATPNEILETIFHAGVYAGLPVHSSGVAIAKEVFKKRDLHPDPE